MKLFRIIFEEKNYTRKRKISYFVGRDKDDAIRIANESKKDRFEIKNVCYLAESLNFGNTIFVKEDK